MGFLLSPYRFAAAAGPMPAFRAVGSIGQVNSVGSVATAGKPAGTAENDILLMVTEITPGSGTVAALSGWTEHPNSPQSGADSVLQLFWKRAGASEPASWDVPRVSDHTLADVIAISGCVTSGSPFDAAAGDTQAATNTSQSIPGLTTTAANRLIVDIMSIGTDSGTGQFSSFVNGNLSSVTMRLNHGYSGSSGGGLGVADGGKVAAGATGTTAVTIAQALDSRGGHIKVALLPT